MDSKNILIDLKNALISNVSQTPEKLNATFERIEEVAKIVLGDTRSNGFIETIGTRCHSMNKRSEINERHGTIIVDVVKECLEHDLLTKTELISIISLLKDAEYSTSEAIDMHKNHKIPVSELESDIVPVRGIGAWIIDTKGNKYLDMDSNYGAANLGFNNKEIAIGLYNQACQLITMKEDRVQIPRTRLMKTMLPLMPQWLDQFYWQNSGGEAVDKALKIAKACTKQKGVIAMMNGFHGRTHGAVAVTSNLVYRKPFGLDKEEWVSFIPFNDAEALEDRLKQGKEKIVIMELIQSEEGGITLAEKDYVKRVRELCTVNNTVLIIDEVQTGFARVAMDEGQWWASDYYDVTPDIMVIGKSFGGGFPVTAVVTTKGIGNTMKPGYDGSTFGGNPLAMVAATIAIKQMKKMNLPNVVTSLHKQLVTGLKKIKSPLIRDIRGLGLMIALELPSKDIVKKFQSELKKVGVKSSLSTGNTVRFLPPLIITKSEIDMLIKKTEESIRNIDKNVI